MTWAELAEQLDPGEACELAILDSCVAGIDDGIARLSYDELIVVIRGVLATRGDNPASQAILTAWVVLWHRTHPDALASHSEDIDG